MGEITHEDFLKIEFKAGLVKSAENVSGSEKLLKLVVEKEK